MNVHLSTVSWVLGSLSCVFFTASVGAFVSILCRCRGRRVEYVAQRNQWTQAVLRYLEKLHNDTEEIVGVTIKIVDGFGNQGTHTLSKSLPLPPSSSVDVALDVFP